MSTNTNISQEQLNDAVKNVLQQAFSKTYQNDTLKEIRSVSQSGLAKLEQELKANTLAVAQVQKEIQDVNEKLHKEIQAVSKRQDFLSAMKHVDYLFSGSRSFNIATNRNNYQKILVSYYQGENPVVEQVERPEQLADDIQVLIGVKPRLEENRRDHYGRAKSWKVVFFS